MQMEFKLDRPSDLPKSSRNVGGDYFVLLGMGLIGPIVLGLTVIPFDNSDDFLTGCAFFLCAFQAANHFIAVRYGKCRSSLVAALSGMLLGLVTPILFLGIVNLGTLPFPHSNPVDWLHSIIQMSKHFNLERLQRLVIVPGIEAFISLTLWPVILLVSFFVAILPIKLARQLFSDRYDRWMQNLTASYSLNKHSALLAAFEQDRLEDLVTVPATRHAESGPRQTVSLWVTYAHADEDPASNFEAYLSIAPLTPAQLQFGWSQELHDICYLDHARLTLRQVAALEHIFPQLSCITSTSCVEVEAPPPWNKDRRYDAALQSDLLNFHSDSADQLLSDRSRRKRMTQRLNSIFMSVVACLFLFVSFAALASCSSFANGREARFELKCILGCMLTGFLLLLLSLSRLLGRQRALVERRLLQDLNDFLKARPDAVVDIEDRSLELIEVLPPEGAKGAKKRDWGYLKIDLEHGIAYEGLRERWVIPSAAMIDAELEFVNTIAAVPGLGWMFNQPRAMLILQVRLAGKAIELAIIPRGGSEFWSENHSDALERIHAKMCACFLKSQPWIERERASHPQKPKPSPKTNGTLIFVKPLTN